MQFSFTQTAGAVFAVATAAAAAAWYVRGEQIDVLKQQVAAYEASQAMNLKELSEKALDATTKLGKQLDCSKFIGELQEKITKQGTSLQKERQISLKQEKEIEKSESHTNSLNAQLKYLFSDYQEFTLEENAPIKLFGTKYVVSVKDISTDTVYLYFNNAYSSMSVGNYKLMENGSQKCKFFLEKIEPGKKGYFSVLCEKT